MKNLRFLEFKNLRYWLNIVAILSIFNIFLFISCNNDVKIKKLNLSIDNEMPKYTLNSSIREINISASFDTENDYQNKKVSWSLYDNAKLQNNVIVGNDISNKLNIKDDKNISINFTSLNKLSSYVVCAKCDDITTYKTFTLTSDKKLSDNTVYSFIKLDKDFIVDENTGKIISFSYYNLSGVKLQNDNEKAHITENSNITYTSTNKNAIAINVKNSSSFGELTLSTTNNNIDILKNSDASFFITVKNYNEYGFLDSDINDVPFVLKAGDNDTLYFNISFSSVSSSYLNEPDITELIQDERASCFVEITGDKVSTDYNKIENGNSIDITVYRTPLIKSVFDDTFKKISLTKSPLNEWKTEKDIAYISDIDFGYRLYLPYGGSYKIVATLKAVDGYKVSEKILSIPYYTTKNKVSVEYLYPEMKNYSYDNSEIFRTTINGDDYKFEQEDRFRININKSLNENLRFNIIYSSDDENFKSEDYSKNNFDLIYNNSSFSYKGAGVYSQIYVYGVNNKGYGNVYFDENMFNSDGTLIIDDIFSLKQIEIEKLKSPNIKGKIEIIDTGYKYTFKLEDTSDYFKDKKIYARFFKTNTGKTDGFISNDFRENEDTEIVKDKEYSVILPFDTQDLNDYKLMCFVHCPQTLSYTSDVYILPKFYTEDFSVNTEKVVLTNLIDPLQDKENLRKFEIRNVRDETGYYKILKYKFNNEEVKTLGSDSIYYIYSNKTTTDDQTLTVYAYNQNHSHCETTEISFKLEKLVNNISYYREDCWRGTWDVAGYYWPSQTHYENTEFLKFPYYVVSYTTRGYIGEVKKLITSPQDNIVFYSSAGRCYGVARQHYMVSSYLMKYGYISSDVIEVPCNGDAWFGDYENCL